MPAVIRSIEIQAAPSSVWRWMSSPECLRRWLGPELDIDLRVGGAYRLRGPDENTWISGCVLELVPEGSLVLSWLEEGGDWLYPARLALTLTPVEDGTRVTLVHDGFAGIGKPGWPATKDAYERGADRHRILDKLAGLVGGRA
jgi:uncharacterized protein YndB with AHSA1/START domain